MQVCRTQVFHEEEGLRQEEDRVQENPGDRLAADPRRAAEPFKGRWCERTLASAALFVWRFARKPMEAQPMADDVKDAIEKNAKGPRRAKGGVGEVQQHSLKDQVEADRYLAPGTPATSPRGRCGSPGSLHRGHRTAPSFLNSSLGSHWLSQTTIAFLAGCLHSTRTTSCVPPHCRQ